MSQSLQSQQSSRFLMLAVSMVTCLILLINVSFKLILLQELVFAVSSFLCPLIAGLYLLVLRNCSLKEQRHVLNSSLMTVYIFCIGVYVLVNLPAAEYMHDNHVYQTIFEDIPKKFFATTIGFALSFYLPHLLFCSTSNEVLSSPKKCALLALLGGLSFFCIDFFLLFSGPLSNSFKHIFIDSLMIASLLLLIICVIYLSFMLDDKPNKGVPSLCSGEASNFPLYHYMLCFAVAIILMCIACEYRIVSFSKDVILAASCIFFPIALIISTLIGELWGYQANLKLTFVVISAQLIFDTLLMGLVAFPSPSFFNLNPFYNYIMPRRLPAASLSLFVCFISNAMLLHYLKRGKWKLPGSLRITIANLCANSLLCLVDYSLLFGGIYPSEQVINLAVSVWEYKLLMTLAPLPLVVWLSNYFKKNNRLVLQRN